MSSASDTPQSSAQEKLLLVDAHAYAYRAFHAIRSLSAPDGAPTNAIFGFIKMILKLEDQYAPSHIAIIWDGGLAPERLSLLPEYKAQRPPTPDSLAQQIPQIQDWVRARNRPSLQIPDTEADDWIATLAHHASSAGWQTLIASSDKDFLQLVSQNIGIINPNDKSEKIWQPHDVVAKTGVEPHQIVDWLSLIGDAVDNIPGVPGVGPKTATDLLRRFGSVESLLNRLSEIKTDKLRANLWGAADAVRRNQQMIRLRSDLANPPSLPSLCPGPQDVDQLRTLYSRWGFRSLLAQVSPPNPTPSPSAPVQTELL